MLQELWRAQETISQAIFRAAREATQQGPRSRMDHLLNALAEKRPTVGEVGNSGGRLSDSKIDAMTDMDELEKVPIIYADTSHHGLPT